MIEKNGYAVISPQFTLFVPMTLIIPQETLEVSFEDC